MCQIFPREFALRGLVEGRSKSYECGGDLENICSVHYLHVKKSFFFFFYYCSVVFTSINVNQVSVSLVNTMMLSEEILVTIRER